MKQRKFMIWERKISIETTLMFFDNGLTVCLFPCVYISLIKYVNCRSLYILFDWLFFRVQFDFQKPLKENKNE